MKVLFTLCLSVAIASEFRYLKRSPKALLMGDAYTAIADDEYTLYYNPAALARHSGLSFNVVNPDLALTNVLGELDRFQNFPSSDAVAIANRVLGLPLYFKVAGTPGLKLGSMGISMMANSEVSLTIRNSIHPMLDLDFRYDRGLVMGGAWTVWGKNPRRSSTGESLNIGAAVKNINRQGNNGSYDLFGTDLLNIINTGSGNDISSIRDALGYSYGEGWGADVAMEYVYQTNVSRWVLATSLLDIADTKLRKTGGVGSVEDQKMTLNFGTSWKQDFFLFDYTLALDYHPANIEMDWKRKFHFGMEVGIPFMDIFFGWNGGYISYGLGINFWPVRIITGFYGIETGTTYHEEEAKRFLFYLSLLHISFDA